MLQHVRCERDAIVTRYLGPTNTLGSRIKATNGRQTITLPYDHVRTPDGNHYAAARKLAGHDNLVGGCIAPRKRVWVVML
jgi:hypothetical protein